MTATMCDNVLPGAGVGGVRHTPGVLSVSATGTGTSLEGGAGGGSAATGGGESVGEAGADGPVTVPDGPSAGGAGTLSAGGAAGAGFVEGSGKSQGRGTRATGMSLRVKYHTGECYICIAVEKMRTM